MLVAHKDDYSYLITSGHVCDIDFGRLSDLPGFKFELEFYGLTLKMKKHDFQIVAIDGPSDLCLLRTKKLDLPPYKIASLKRTWFHFLKEFTVAMLTKGLFLAFQPSVGHLDHQFLTEKAK
jgi:hypothetical protein